MREFTPTSKRVSIAPGLMENPDGGGETTGVGLMVDGGMVFWMMHHHLPARSFLCSLESRGRGQRERKERTQELEQQNSQREKAFLAPRPPPIPPPAIPQQS